MITLYLATHNITGLKYFGKTVTHHNIDDLLKYGGSGVYWSRHLKKHGNDISMEIFYQSDNEDVIQKVALMYSRFWDIVESKDYANLIPENGIGGGSGFKGRKHSEESKEKNRNKHIGKKHSEESKRKISDATKGENNPMYGRIHSEESKEKNRQSNIGKLHTDETIEKMSISQNKRFESIEERLKCISRGMKDKTHTEETKEKISNKAKERFEVKENHPMYGKKHSEETKNKMKKPKSKEHKEKLKGAKPKNCYCKYCNKYFDAANYKRWHGKNCKKIKGF